MAIVVSFSGLEIKEKGVIRLGGEGKFAYYEKISEFDLPQSLPLLDSSTNKFKLNLLTPTIFEKGWLPKKIDENNGFLMENRAFGIRLVAAAVGKYSLVGGYDMAKKAPKPMVKVVPAGSTYYFEVLHGETEKIFEHFHLKSISDQLIEEGYGIGIISSWRD